MAVRRIGFGVVLMLLLTACGGGGGGSKGPEYSISISPGSITFDGAQFAAIPLQTVTVNYKGDGVIVGTLPGQFQPSWLTVHSAGTSAGSASFMIQATPGSLQPGTHSFTLRFVTGKADGSSAVYRDLPVTLNLREGFSTTVSEIRFTAVEGTNVLTPNAGLPITITGENIAWTAQAPAWLRLSQVSGSARGTITATVNAQGMAQGRYQEWIVFRDSISGREIRVLAVMEIMEPRFVVSAQEFNVTIDPQTVDAATRFTFQISDTGLGQNAAKTFAWTATSGSPLLRVTPTSGNTSTTATLTVELNRDQLNAIRTGESIQAITIATRSYDTFYVRFRLTTRMPRAGAAFPYVLAAGTPTTVSLAGADILAEDLGRVRLNRQPLSAFPGATAALTSTSEIALSLPAMTAGTYDVSFDNALGLSRSRATLKVINTSAPGAGEISSSGNRVKLLFDRVRNRLLAVDTLEGEIERYEWNGSQWTTLPAIALPGLLDAALLRDGKQAVATAAGGLTMLDLDSGDASLDPGTAHLDCPSSSPLNTAVTEQGLLFASVSGYICGPNPYSIGAYSDIQELDLLSGYMDNPVPLDNLMTWFANDAALATSGDGRYLVLGENGTSGGRYGVFDTRTREFFDRGDSFRFGLAYYYRLDVDRAGSKVVVNNQIVRNRSGATLGLLPANAAASISADGTRAYIYVHGAGGTGHIEVIDLTTPVGNQEYPQLGADIPVPSDLGAPGGVSGNVTSFDAALSTDERLLFVSGSTRIVAIALP